MKIKYDKLLGEIREDDSIIVNGKVPSELLPSYIDDVIEGYYKEADGLFYTTDSYTVLIPGETGKIYVDKSTEDCYRWSGSLFIKISSGGGTTGGEIRIRIPGEIVADTSYHQGIFWKNTTGNTVTISNVSFNVSVAAAGSGAACAFNIYKSSGTLSNGIDTSAVNLFTSAVDLTTNYESLTNVPNTTTVENGRWVSLRCTSSAGATNKASDAEIIIIYS